MLLMLSTRFHECSSVLGAFPPSTCRSARRLNAEPRTVRGRESDTGTLQSKRALCIHAGILLFSCNTLSLMIHLVKRSRRFAFYAQSDATCTSKVPELTI